MFILYQSYFLIDTECELCNKLDFALKVEKNT